MNNKKYNHLFEIGTLNSIELEVILLKHRERALCSPLGNQV